MGFLDELKKLTHPYDENDDDFFGSASDDEPAVEEEEARTSRRSSFFSDPDEAEPESVGIPSAPRVKPKIRIPKRELRRQADAADAEEAKVQRAGRAAPANANANGQPYVSAPMKFEDGGALANTLATGRTVILNLENTNKVDARRLLDFMSGAAFVLGGYVKRISGTVFSVLPDGDEGREADALSQVETSGQYF